MYGGRELAGEGQGAWDRVWGGERKVVDIRGRYGVECACVG